MRPVRHIKRAGRTNRGGTCSFRTTLQRPAVARIGTRRLILVRRHDRIAHPASLVHYSAGWRRSATDSPGRLSTSNASLVGWSCGVPPQFCILIGSLISSAASNLSRLCIERPPPERCAHPGVHTERAPSVRLQPSAGDRPLPPRPAPPHGCGCDFQEREAEALTFGSCFARRAATGRSIEAGSFARHSRSMHAHSDLDNALRRRRASARAQDTTVSCHQKAASETGAPVTLRRCLRTRAERSGDTPRYDASIR